ncbi:MAG TPA: hypothetical protein VNI83_00480 [Vicinamibacterales bacterium]|nr:hypothetical protein [Vicinamibacterales bacterium]
MVSESARMNSAAEARFRVQSPNSLPRTIRVVALDEAGDRVVARLARQGWSHATFSTASAFPPPAGGDAAQAPDGWLRDLGGHPRRLADEVQEADLVVMVAGPGGRAHAAPVIGEACSRRRIMTTTLLVGAGTAPEPALSATLAQVRPWSLMLVIAGADEYIEDMLTALRAA